MHWQRWDFYNAPQPARQRLVRLERALRRASTSREAHDGARGQGAAAVALLARRGARRLRRRPLARGATPLPRRRARAAGPAASRCCGRTCTCSRSRTRTSSGRACPVRYDAGDAPLVSHVPGFAELPSGLTRDFRYTVWSYAPQPTPAQLAALEADLSGRARRAGHVPRRLAAASTAPPFGAAAPARRALDAHQELAPLRAALRARRSRSPAMRARRTPRRWRSRRGSGRRAASPTRTSRRSRPERRRSSTSSTQTRAGYCQHFAGAMALMLRYLGVPARVAVGFSSGTYDATSGIWRVTDHDAHAWVEAWFRGYGWLPFDPTPAGAPGARAAERAVRGRVGAPRRAAAAGGRAVGAGPNDPRQAAHRHGEQEGTGVRRRSAAAPRPRVAARTRQPASCCSLLVGGAVARHRRRRSSPCGARATSRATRGGSPPRAARSSPTTSLDQHIDAARSATLHELGALVRHELAVEPDAFVARRDGRAVRPARRRGAAPRATPAASCARSLRAHARAPRARATACAGSSRCARSASRRDATRS